MITIDAGPYTITLQGETGAFQPSLTQISAGGVYLITLALTVETPQVPPSLTLHFTHPSVDIQGQWDTGCDWRRAKSVDWGGGRSSKATSNAPVMSLYNLRGQNRLTFAFSDALRPVQCHAGIVEETGLYECLVKLFQESGPPVTHYEASLRLDTRDLPYFESLGDVSGWWAGLPGYAPAPVPDVARRPMYSTWYSFHLELTPEGIETQCRLARELGCEAVIVDDGWQTLDSGRGYAHCGDWKAERIPDMASHVARVHALGMKYLLWYSVPFVGEHSKAWARFEGKFLSVENIEFYPGNFGVLDPRFPDVREYLIQTYETALREWDLDGFKLDFVDSFNITREKQLEHDPRRDMESVPEAVDRLLSDVITRLRAIKPDICIEFRQSYIGPLMRKYGNMFRAGDCPNDAVTNRIRTLDIRLLCGGTAAHADMVMWHPDEPVEAAALQLIHTLFAVPQLSVRIDALPPEHLAMTRWWLAFWNTYRDVLLDGKLQPLHPNLLYPIVIASTGKTRIMAAYADMVLRPGPDMPEELWVVNGTQSSRLVLELDDEPGSRQLTVRDCQGSVIHDGQTSLISGLHSFEVPPSGTICLKSTR